jgi:hypothetical protein
MARGRRVPPPIHPAAPAARDEHAERRAALLSLDLAQIRAWAAAWLPDGDNTIALADDASLLISAHEARLRDEGIPAEDRYISALVLAAQGDELALAVLAKAGEQTKGGEENARE